MTNTEMITSSRIAHLDVWEKPVSETYAVSSLKLPLNFLDLSNFNITDLIFVFFDEEKNCLKIFYNNN